MKMDAIMKAIEKAEERGMAEETLDSLPAEGIPADIPAAPNTEVMGPPEVTPPVESGELPEFDEATGLPFIAVENFPEQFPAEAESHGEVGDILDYLFL